MSVVRVRELAIAHGFGHEVHLDRVPAGSKAAARTGWYVAKYVTKSATEQPGVPWVNLETGEVGPGRWRVWSSSRRWGATMAEVRRWQRGWISEHRSDGGRGALARTDCAVGALDPNTHHSGISVIEAPVVGVAQPM